jgi:hypothetical protein
MGAFRKTQTTVNNETSLYSMEPVVNFVRSSFNTPFRNDLPINENDRSILHGYHVAFNQSFCFNHLNQ